jgi:SAM-dependent methyltransferase
MSEQDWWKTFFQGPALECWTRAVPDQQTREEADFLQQTLNVPAGASVLDVPCGNGRLSRALAERGLRMTGVDIAAEYVDGARARSAAGGPAVEWHQGDMRELAWDAAFDGAFSFGNSFGYFDDAGNAAFLRGVARALRPGATFVLDTGLTAESVLPNFTAQFWMKTGPLYFLAQRSYDPARGVLRSDYTFLQGGGEDCRSAFYRVYTLRELLGMCEQAGFTDLNAFGSFDRRPFALGDRGLLLVARRR